MDLKKGLLLGFALTAVAVGSIAAAKPPHPGELGPRPPGHDGLPPPGHVGHPPPGIMKAPELDATAGIQAIALLSGVLLLLGESARRRNV